MDKDRINAGRIRWQCAPFYGCGIGLLLFLMFPVGVSIANNTDYTEFNTDVLEVQDKENIDLQQFSRRGYIMPGEYLMTVSVNGSGLADEYPITFYVPKGGSHESIPCLTSDLIHQLGLKPEWEEQALPPVGEQCADLTRLSGLTVEGELATSTLRINLPKHWLEYMSLNWDPPSRWDQGVTGLLFDYSVLGSLTRQQKGEDTRTISGNGVTGMNFGAWRLRADWQYQQRNSRHAQKRWEWNRYYAYRALARLHARLDVGENDLDSAVFESFRFTGVTVSTDDSMLPPGLRGYAPEVTGVAQTNARVTIRQQGRVLYETQVAAGPFRIQELSDAVSGILDVEVEEQDGKLQTFQVNTASIPYLTRPGRFRYKLSTGWPSRGGHKVRGKGFAAGEISWGISNGWSLYSGAISNGDYHALSLGVGRDLLKWGALSLDISHSQARLPLYGMLRGNSYRVSYSKRFEEYDSQITFAGYRFSERNFMTMNNWLDARYHQNLYQGNSKELYTITFNKHFRDQGLSLFLNYDRQTWWERPASERWNLALSRYFNFAKWRNISINLSAYRSRFNQSKDDGVYLGLSVPLGREGTLSYNTTVGRHNRSNEVSWYQRINNHNNYRISAGTSSRGRATVNGYWTREGDISQMTASASWTDSLYQAATVSLQGGLTATRTGIALHRNTLPGSTRVMIDTEVSGVPIQGAGASISSGLGGIGVISEVNSYYRSPVSVDVSRLPDNLEAIHPVTHATLTAGAIGVRRLGVVSGRRLLATLTLKDGSSPPFGARVLGDGREIGIVNDDGSVWLAGIEPNKQLIVSWQGEAQCRVDIPAENQLVDGQSIALPCAPLSAVQRTENEQQRQNESED